MKKKPTSTTTTAQTADTIRRVDAVRLIDTTENTRGRRSLFAIQFYNLRGEVVSFPHAYACGLRFNMKSTRMRGIQQTDHLGNPIGHPHPVSIDNLRTFNNKKVTL
ncbi:MAG: hypothetical protein IJU19_09175 [Bacteroidales bacterium]|nr:hypothetical protein [Bacteroidales bacterium]